MARTRFVAAVAVASILGVLAGANFGGTSPVSAQAADAPVGIGEVKLWSGGSAVMTWSTADEPSIINGAWAFNAVSRRAGDGAVIQQPITLSGTVSYHRYLTP